jgi:uncharacterized membrane protein
MADNTKIAERLMLHHLTSGGSGSGIQWLTIDGCKIDNQGAPNLFQQ